MERGCPRNDSLADGWVGGQIGSGRQRGCEAPSCWLVMIMNQPVTRKVVLAAQNESPAPVSQPILPPPPPPPPPDQWAGWTGEPG